jgi:hypothetical protein
MKNRGFLGAPGFACGYAWQAGVSPALPGFSNNLTLYYLSTSVMHSTNESL